MGILNRRNMLTWVFIHLLNSCYTLGAHFWGAQSIPLAGCLAFNQAVAGTSPQSSRAASSRALLGSRRRKRAAKDRSTIGAKVKTPYSRGVQRDDIGLVYQNQAVHI